MNDIVIDDLSLFIDRLNRQSDRVGSVVIPSSSDEENVLIIFAGNLERFSMLSVARNVNCKVIYFQDSISWWYQGSDILPHLDLICDGFLREQVGTLRPFFFGQSSGGYASLVAGAYFPQSRVLACAPQVASDRSVKQALVCSRHIAIRCAPEGLTNIPELWQSLSGQGSEAAVVFSASEAGNPIGSHFWMDFAHCLRMLGIVGVTVFMMANNVHAVVHRNARAFADLIQCLLLKGQAVSSAAEEIRTALDRMSEEAALSDGA